MTIRCCVCKKEKSGNNWVKRQTAEAAVVSHGYCPACAVDFRKEIALQFLRKDTG